MNRTRPRRPPSPRRRSPGPLPCPAAAAPRTDRRQFHLAAVRVVLERLRRIGVRATPVPGNSAVSVRCGSLELAVRAARLSTNHHIVTVRGIRYEYVYDQYNWNLACHGERRDADVWVLCLFRGRRWGCFVVPGACVNGSYTINTQAKRLLEGEHWLADYRERWDIVRDNTRCAA